MSRSANHAEEHKGKEYEGRSFFQVKIKQIITRPAMEPWTGWGENKARGTALLKSKEMTE